MQGKRQQLDRPNTVAERRRLYQKSHSFSGMETPRKIERNKCTTTMTTNDTITTTNNNNVKYERIIIIEIEEMKFDEQATMR